MSYATREQILALAHPDLALDNLTEAELDRLISEGMDDVDWFVGARQYDGRAVDVTVLADWQLDALARATAIAVAHRASLDPEDLVGADAYTPSGMSTLRVGQLPPSRAIAGALAGTGLLARRVCASPPPLDAA